MNLTMKNRGKVFFSDQAGSMAFIAAIAAAALMGIVAFAIDVGHLVVIKNELQKAVDAGALAGARALVPFVTTSIPPQPNWSQGRTMATQTVTLNKVDSQLLTNSQVQAGYWNTGTKTLQSTAISPGAGDVPAILVSAAKTAGQNGGPVEMFFAPLLGINTSTVSAKALAFISAPAGIPAGGGGFPMATPKALVDQYWYQDPPISFKIGSAYHNPVGGQWTSFLEDSNNVPTIRNLIANGNPAPLNVGDNIWIQPGTKTTLYSDAASMSGKTVILPVVTTDFDTHSYTPILSFVAFYIEDAVGGSGKYVQGHFVKDYAITNGTPGGAYNGTFIPPKEAYY